LKIDPEKQSEIDLFKIKYSPSDPYEKYSDRPTTVLPNRSIVYVAIKLHPELLLSVSILSAEDVQNENGDVD
jgi:hypothetical protein